MKIQSDVYVIILVTLLLSIAILLLSHKLDKTDPLEKPKGIIVPLIMGMQSVYRTCMDNLGKRKAEKYVPYIIVLWGFIFLHFPVWYIIPNWKSQCHIDTGHYYLGNDPVCGIQIWWYQSLFP